jgi:alpha-beta hydrolase superfamily lysophospholipase
VCALYNQSINLGHDVLQAVTDKMNITDKPVVKALCNLLCDAFHANTPLHIAAHSHGAVVVSKALSDTISILKRSGAKEKRVFDGISG